jgi:hypothetical protein
MEPEIHEAEKIDDLPAAVSQVVKYMRKSQRCRSNIMVSFQAPHHWIMVKPCETPIHIISIHTVQYKYCKCIELAGYLVSHL